MRSDIAKLSWENAGKYRLVITAGTARSEGLRPLPALCAFILLFIPSPPLLLEALRDGQPETRNRVSNPLRPRRSWYISNRVLSLWSVLTVGRSPLAISLVVTTSGACTSATCAAGKGRRIPPGRAALGDPPWPTSRRSIFLEIPVVLKIEVGAGGTPTACCCCGPADLMGLSA